MPIGPTQDRLHGRAVVPAPCSALFRWLVPGPYQRLPVDWSTELREPEVCEFRQLAHGGVTRNNPSHGSILAMDCSRRPLGKRSRNIRNLPLTSSQVKGS